MNPQAPGWNKRLRIGAAAPSRTPFPPRVSAFEKAVRCFAKNPSENGKARVKNTRSCRCECPALIRLLQAEGNRW
ncbi:hypothetical protein ACQJBY_012817 [Aegilops geniculata]